MPLFKFDKFPDVCRLCLRSDSYEAMIPLDTADPVFEGSICDFISAITFVILDEKSHLFPQMVCAECLELLKFFAKYRNKIMTVHLLMNSLVELKRNNPIPIVDLFESKRELLKALFKDLDLCSKENVLAQDFIDEFLSCETSATSVNIKEEPVDAICIETLKRELNFSIECTLPESGSEITGRVEVVPKRKIRAPKKYLDNQDVPPVFNDKNITEDTAERNVSPNSSNSAPIKKYGGRKLDEPLHCSKCKFVTYYTRNLESHQLLHRKQENREYRCKVEGCSAVFKERRAYRCHCDVVHKLYVCELCGLRCSTLHALQNHKERHLKNYNYQCQYCQKACNTKNDLRTHIRVWHAASTKYACETCGLEFKRKDIRDTHMKTHADVFEFPCSLCDKKFKNAAALKKHRNRIHELITFPCQHCSSAYGTRGKLLDHVEYAHGIQTHFICEICVQSFDSQDKLDNHRIRHDNPKELECAICLSVFESQEQLGDHLCITYRDDYICCDRDLRYHYPYNKHMFTKHGIKTNARVKPVPGQLLGFIRAKRKRHECCPKCEQIFPTRTKKNRHMEICDGTTENSDSAEKMALDTIPS